MNIITIITLSLCAVCFIGVIILIVRINALKSAMPDVSTKDLDRLENQLTEDNRNERQELTGNLDKIRKELSESAAQQRQEAYESAKSHREELSKSLLQFQEAFDKDVERLGEILKERFEGLDKGQGSLRDYNAGNGTEMADFVPYLYQETRSC